MGNNNSVHHSTSLGIALPTPSRPIGPLHSTSGIQCIDKSEVYVHLLKCQLEPEYHGKDTAPLHSDVHPTDKY